MNWFWWTYLILTAMDGLGRILSIAEPREPRTPKGVALDTILNGLLTAGVVYYGIMK